MSEKIAEWCLIFLFASCFLGIIVAGVGILMAMINGTPTFEWIVRADLNMILLFLVVRELCP